MFAHIPRPALSLVMEYARVYRDGAKTRTRMGSRVGDNAFADEIHDAAADLARLIRHETGMHVPPRTLRPFLWRAARVGEAYAT
jgi:hypothetical protein